MNAPQQPEIGRSDPDDPNRFVGTYLTAGPASPWRSRPAHWAIAAAAIAAVVCLAAWPRPTTYAAALITGAVVLLVGLRLLAAERGQTGRPPYAGCAGCGGPDCAQRPDASGAGPETARTGPDAPETQPVDQPGHDPDDLRNQLADAIRDRIDAEHAVTIAVRARKADEQRARNTENAAKPAVDLRNHLAKLDLHRMALADALGFQAQRTMLGWPALLDAVLILYALKEDHRRRVEATEATIARVESALAKAPGRSLFNHYANAQDDGWDQAIDHVRAALTPPAAPPEEPHHA